MRAGKGKELAERSDGSINTNSLPIFARFCKVEGRRRAGFGTRLCVKASLGGT